MQTGHLSQNGFFSLNKKTNTIVYKYKFLINNDLVRNSWAGIKFE